MTSVELLASLRFRYAAKRFDPTRQIPAEEWAALEQALLLSPSSFGLQPWRFLVVNDPALRERLHAVSWGQSQVKDASRYVVFVARTEFTEEDLDRWMAVLAEAQGSAVESLAGYRGVIAGFASEMSVEEVFNWNVRQCYLALGQFMASAASIGVDTCPLEGINAASYDGILGLEGSGYRTVFACAVGYRAKDDKYALMPKARFPLEEVVRHH